LRKWVSFHGLSINVEPDLSHFNGIVPCGIEILSLFTARMQHHFARGPFSKELRKRLIAAEQTDLADTAYHYFLAANVLKHGSGSSYHALRKIKGLPFAVKQPDGSGQVQADGLIDVHADGFLDELVATLAQTKQVLDAG